MLGMQWPGEPVKCFLPRSYVQGFIDREASEDEAPSVWIHRPAIGVFQRGALEADGANRHFNDVDEPALLKNEELERQLAAVEADASRIVQERLLARAALTAGERDTLASFFALLGIRLSARFGELPEGEAQRGFDELVPVLREMGWVFWEAEPPDYFISSNGPFRVAFPTVDGLAEGMQLHAPNVEITLPLTPNLALHATWSRRGEIWRHATEDVLLELNARTLLGARKFVLSPKPAIPG
jgi:hypothetical protein